MQLSDRKLREPEEKQELRELWELFRSQERELHEMRLRLSRFMTKGAPVFLQPPKTESKVPNQKSKYQPHVHFSRSLTNGSNGEPNHEEHFPDALEDVKSKLYKGRPGYHGKTQAASKGDEFMEGNYSTEMFDNKDLLQDPQPKKKSVKKSSGGARPKSSRAGGKRQKPSKPSSSNNLGIEDELLMEAETHQNIEIASNEGHQHQVENMASPVQDTESKHDSEVGDGNDDTSKDFTSLSLATASASGGKQTNPKISVTDDAQ